MTDKSLQRAIERYRALRRQHVVAMAKLKRLVEQYPDLGDSRPLIDVGVWGSDAYDDEHKKGERLRVRCPHDISMALQNGFQGSTYGLMQLFEHHHADALKPHTKARRVSGIVSAEKQKDELGSQVKMAQRAVLRLRPSTLADAATQARFVLNCIRVAAKELGPSPDRIKDWKEWRDDYLRIIEDLAVPAIRTLAS